MNRRSIKEILHDEILNDHDITVCGWVKTRRDSKIGISFLNIYDGSCLDSMQIVVKNDIENYKSEILKITSGCSIKVIGKLILSSNKKQKFEIEAKKIKILGWVQNPEKYPISAKNHSLEYLREVAHLRARTNVIGAVARVRHVLSHSLHNFLNKNGYFWISTPIITSSNAEGAGDVFRVLTVTSNQNQKNISIDYNKDFFNKEVFLTVSGQLNAEMYASALSKVYTFGPVFRAENSNTSRHLAEFWMLEPEMAYADLNDACRFAELLLKDSFEKVLDICFDEILFFSENFYKNIITRLKKSIENPFVHIEYGDAVKILIDSNKKFKDTVYWGIDFSSEHERFLTEKYFQCPIIIKNYPKKIKAFYMRVNDDNKTVASMDLLVPGVGEILGGSQREERLNMLDKNLDEKKLNKKDYWWYRDLRKYGSVQHSGFGLGFERLLLYVTGMKNIRDVIAFPRTPHHINF